LPEVVLCADLNDNCLLGLAQAGAADWLVTGDKRDLLGLQVHGRARIVTVRMFLSIIGRLP
jgi:predicted nucleic acid-binding protein